MVKELALVFLILAASATALTFTVSGLSSGGFAASQLHVAYSATVNGVAIVAGGPYYCSLGQLVRVQTACTENPWLINVAQSVAYANQQASDSLIDPTSYLANSKVVIFSGSLDVEVIPAVVNQTYAFYLNYVNPSQITTVYSVPANHGWVTLNEGNPCWYLGTPYVLNCGFDLAGAAVNTFYGPGLTRGVYNSSHLYSFDQAKYADVWQAGLSNRGWIYLNDACKANPSACPVHVNIHGCSQSYDQIGNTYITEIGLNDWAEPNNVILIYPQTVAGSENIYGCWDFWGYTDQNFAIKSGLQISAIWNMAQNYTKIVQGLSS